MENLDLRATANLLNKTFKPKTLVSVEYLEWQYHKNPFGPACVGYLLEKNEQLSNYALIPKNFKNHLGEKVALGIGVDLAVSPDSRGKGLFRKTVENSYKAGIIAAVSIKRTVSSLDPFHSVFKKHRSPVIQIRSVQNYGLSQKNKPLSPGGWVETFLGP